MHNNQVGFCSAGGGTRGSQFPLMVNGKKSNNKLAFVQKLISVQLGS